MDGENFVSDYKTKNSAGTLQQIFINLFFLMAKKPARKGKHPKWPAGRIKESRLFDKKPYF
jgi:hypothetical protein